jgi:hypothetical protein
MKKISLLLICLFSLNAPIAVAGHTARAATRSGTGGTGIETINDIGPTNAHNFTIESSDDSVTITGLPHGIDVSVPASIETLNGISPDSIGNFTVNAGAGAIITAGINSFTISAPGGGSGVSTIVADSAGFATGNVVISGGSTGLTTDATSSTEIDLTGVLNLSHGGTNASLTASNGGIFYSTSSAGAILSGTATANQVLLSGSSSAPSWSTATYPATTTANDLLYSSSSNTVGQITTANDGVLITSNTGVPSWLANSSTPGYVLTANSGAPPSWQVASGGDAILTITGNSGGAESPSSGNFNIVGTGSITTVGSANTETVQLTGLTNHSLLVGAGTDTITNVGPSSTSGQILQSAGSSADPAFSTATYPSTTTANQILYSSATNTVGQITTANDGVLITSNTGVPSWLANSSTPGYVLTANSGAPPSWQVAAGGSTEGVSEFVVDSQGGAGYTNIQAAINAAALIATATTPQTVWIWPGTYTENLTLAPHVYLSSANEAGVMIVGNASYTPAANGEVWAARAVSFITPSGGGDAFIVAGTYQANVFFNDCFFTGTHGDCFSMSNSNGGTNAYWFNCKAISSSGFKIWNFTSATQANFYGFNCVTQSTNTASTIQGDVLFELVGCTIQDCFVNSNANAECYIESSHIIGIAALPIINLSVQFSDFIIYNSTLVCTNQYWATGPGTLFYGNITCFGSALGGRDGVIIDPTIGATADYFLQTGPVSFDGGNTGLDTFTQGTVNQVLLGTGTSAISTVSGTGTTGQVLTSNGTGADPTWEDSGGGASTEGVSLFVVDSAGNAGYTTIQDAVNAAALIATSTTPQTVWIWPGTYTEDLTLEPWVNLASAALGVTINGSATFTPTSDGQQFTCNHLIFNGVSGDAVTIGGTNSCTVIFNLCEFNGTAGNAFTCTNGNGSTNIYQYNCILSCTSGNQIYSTSGSGTGSTIFAYSCSSISSGNPSTISDLNEIFLNSCQMVDSFSLIGSDSFMLVNSCFLTAIGNIGFGPLFTLDGSNIYVFNTSVSTQGTYWIEGTGELFYTAVFPANFSSEIQSTITVSPGPPVQAQGISFDGGITTLDTATQGTVNQVLLGTGTSAVNTVSGTGTTGQVLTSNGTGADPTWENSGSILAITPVSTNYDVLLTDYFVKCTAGGINITLPSSSVPTGQAFVIKDSGGNAFLSPITITVEGGILIDGSASYSLSRKYQSAGVLYDGAGYEIFSSYAGL